MFENRKILHASEMNDQIYKKKFNKRCIILGNWNNVNKGKLVVDDVSFGFCEELSAYYNNGLEEALDL